MDEKYKSILKIILIIIAIFFVFFIIKLVFFASVIKSVSSNPNFNPTAEEERIRNMRGGRY